MALLMKKGHNRFPELYQSLKYWRGRKYFTYPDIYTFKENDEDGRCLLFTTGYVMFVVKNMPLDAFVGDSLSRYSLNEPEVLGIESNTKKKILLSDKEDKDLKWSPIKAIYDADFSYQDSSVDKPSHSIYKRFGSELLYIAPRILLIMDKIAGSASHDICLNKRFLRITTREIDIYSTYSLLEKVDTGRVKDIEDEKERIKRGY